MSGLLRLFPSFMFRNFRKFPFFIFHHVYHFRNIAVLSRLLCSVISGIFRHSYINIISSFRNIPWFLPSFLLRHLRTSRPEYTVVFLSFMFRRFRKCRSFFRLISSVISAIFCHSYSINTSSFPDYSVFFPSFMLRHFREFPFFIFHHVYHFRNIAVFYRFFCSVISGNFCLSYFIISGLFRRRPVLAVRSQFDPGLLSLRTETQQNLPLGI